MNATNILLGLTSLLIVIAFAFSFGDFSQNRSNDGSQEELAQLKKDLEKIEAQNRLFEVNQLRGARTNYPAPLPTTPDPLPLPIAPGPAAESTPDQETLDRIAKLEEDRRKQEEELVALRSENEAANQERDEIRVEQTRAAREVQRAMDMGTVKSADKNLAIVIYEPSSQAPNFQPGKVLAVRRNTGIVGTIVIERLDASGQYMATMRPHGYSPDGYPDIQPGDTIIVDPRS